MLSKFYIKLVFDLITIKKQGKRKSVPVPEHYVMKT
jgi:hypothetical protein